MLMHPKPSFLTQNTLLLFTVSAHYRNHSSVWTKNRRHRDYDHRQQSAYWELCLSQDWTSNLWHHKVFDCFIISLKEKCFYCWKWTIAVVGWHRIFYMINMVNEENIMMWQVTTTLNIYCETHIFHYLWYFTWTLFDILYCEVDIMYIFLLLFWSKSFPMVDLWTLILQFE